MKSKILILSLGFFVAHSAFATSINQSSTNANSGNKAGKSNAQMQQAMYAAMAAIEASQCGPKSPQMCALAALHAAMAMMAGKQAKEHGNVAGQAFDTGTATEASGGSTTTDGGGTAEDSVDRAVAGDANFRALDDNMKRLVNGIEGAKINLKDGTVKYNGKDLTKINPTSAADLKSAGFSDSDIATAMALKEKVDESVAKKLGALTKESGFSEGGGGGGATSVGSGDETPSGAAVAKAAVSDRGPANLSGMQKNFNGEPIGVAADSIFLMMNRRYQVKDKQNSFYSEIDLALKQK